MKNLSFFKGLSWLLLLNLLIKPVWIFFIDRQVQNMVGNEAYGRYFAALNLSYVLFFLADAGLSNMLNQRVAYASSVNLKQLLNIKLFLIILYCLLCFFTGWIAHMPQWMILLYVVLIQAMTSLFTFLRSIVSAHQFFTTDAWFSVVDKLLMTIICGSIMYGSFYNSLSLSTFLRIQLVCTTFAVVLAGLFLYYKKVFRAMPAERLVVIAKRIFPFAMIILLMSVHYRLDGFLLERMHPGGAWEAGIYASAYRLLDASNMIGYLAASFLVPFVARNYKDTSVWTHTVLYTRHALLLGAIALVSFMVVYAPWLQQLLYHSGNAYQTLVLQCCIAALPGYFLVHIYGSVLTATLRLNIFIRILLATVVVNLALNVGLIPRYGALGCCIAAITSQYLCGIVCWMFVSKHWKLSVDLPSVGLYLLTAVLLTGLFYWGQRTVQNVWMMIALAAGIVCILLATRIHFVRKYFILIR